MDQIIKEITQDQIKTDITPFKVGDGVRVHIKIREGDKERIQIFSGIVIERKGGGIHETFTVRRVTSGSGVERIFPLHSPNVAKVEVERESVIMRQSNLYYMRGLIGKKANQVKEKAFSRK